MVTNLIYNFQTGSRVQTLHEEIDDLNAVVRSMAIQNKARFSRDNVESEEEQKISGTKEDELRSPGVGIGEDQDFLSSRQVGLSVLT